MSESDGFDDLLTNIGFGRWQAVIIITTLLIAGQLPVHQVGSSLLSGPMDFHCSHTPPPVETQETYIDIRNLYNDTYFSHTCFNVSLNALDEITGEDVPSDISINNVSIHLTGLPSCPYIEYDTSVFTATVVSRWHLVCEQESFVPLFQMMYNLGGLVGSTIGGHIGDKFGRKRSIQIGSIINLLAILLMVVVPVFPLMLALRALIGCSNNVMLIPAWSLALECTPSRHRTLVGMLMGLPYSVGVIFMGGISYFIRSWQYLMLTCSAPVLIIIPFSMYIDESPRWLIQQGHIDQATKILRNAVTKNHVQLPTPLVAKVNELVEVTVSSTPEISTCKESSSMIEARLREILKYLSSPAMRIILLATPVLWFLQSCLYLSVSINANNFTRTDPFLYVALTGMMDGSAILLSTPLATRFGRRIMIFGGMFVGAILFLLDLLVPTDYYWCKWVMVMAGFLLISGSFQVNYVYAPELFPTEARTRGFAFVNVVGNIGFICAPLVTNILAKHTWWAAGVFFGIAGIVGSLMIPFLPETRNKPMPENLQDVEDRRRKSCKKDINGEVNEGYKVEVEKAV